MTDLTRPIVGIENRTAQEVFDIMVDRFRLQRIPPVDHVAAVKFAPHPDQTSPMTVGIEEFIDEPTGLLDRVEKLVESYIGGEFEAQGCAAEQILADIRDLRAALKSEGAE